MQGRVVGWLTLEFNIRDSFVEFEIPVFHGYSYHYCTS